MDEFNMGTVQQAAVGMPAISRPYTTCSNPSTAFVDDSGNTVNVDGLTPCRPDGNVLIVGERRAIMVCNNDDEASIYVVFQVDGVAAAPSASSHLYRIGPGTTLVADVGHNVVPWLLADNGTTTAVPCTWQEFF